MSDLCQTCVRHYTDGKKCTCSRFHFVNGSVNDREWTLVGIGRTPIEAIRNARASLITKGGADV